VIEESISGKRSVKYTSVVDPQLVLLAPLHKKLGLTKNVDKDNESSKLHIKNVSQFVRKLEKFCTEIFSVQLSTLSLSTP
jgi:hypothetical protein